MELDKCLHIRGREGGRERGRQGGGQGGREEGGRDNYIYRSWFVYVGTDSTVVLYGGLLLLLASPHTVAIYMTDTCCQDARSAQRQQGRVKVPNSSSFDGNNSLFWFSIYFFDSNQLVNY